MQSQYYCISERDFPENAEDIIKSKNRTSYDLKGVANIRIAHVKKKPIDGKDYLIGTLLFKVLFDDFDYDVDQSFNLQKRHKSNEHSEEVPFIVELNNKNIIFFNKNAADKFGRKIISHVFFNHQEGITPVNFDIEKIRQDIDNGIFKKCWMNLVSSSGNIKSQKQIGQDIILDPRFIDDTQEYSRKGIGIEIKHNRESFKIAIYYGGSIVLFKSYEEIESNIALYFRILQVFNNYRVNALH